MGYRINVKNLYFAKLTTDDPSQATNKIVYATPKKIAGVQSIDIAPKIQKGELYGEGVKVDAKAKIDSVDLSIDVTKVPLSVRAELLGHTCTNGVMEVTTSDIAPYCALGFEIETSDGKSEFVWYYKCQAEEVKEKAEQSEANIKYSTHTLKFSCIARATDSKIYKLGDSAETGWTATTGTNWFTSVPIA